MSWEDLAGLAGANFIACVVPGQNVALIAAMAAGRGVRAAGAALTGILLAELIWCLAAILTLAGVTEAARAEISTIEAAGAVLLLALGGAMLLDTGGVERTSVGRPGGRALLAGLLVGLANPLAMVFFLGVLPQFVPPGGLGASEASLAVGAVLISTAAALVPYAAGAALIAGRWRRVVSACSGVSMIGLGGAGLIGALG